MMGQYFRKSARAARVGLFAFLTSAAILAQAPDAAARPQKVIELFTSQGCSSCPPADRLAEQLVREGPDILTLLLPVDYWDYLGWRDTLASPVHSERQRAYAARRGDRSVYTPQMVINGQEHVVGSREPEVRAALARAGGFTAAVDLTISDMAVEVQVSGILPEGAKMANIYFLKVKDEEVVDIGRGENAGRSVRYVNVVRHLQPIGMWSGGTDTFRMSTSKLTLTDNARCVVLVQVENAEGPGQIIGATVKDWQQGT